MKEKTIIYISGEGHSGSTLLDIILGAQENAFSLGELINLPQKGILNREYCSCGYSIPTCDLWGEVIKMWEEKRILKIQDYLNFQRYFQSNKNLLFSFFALKYPNNSIKYFINDTYELYNIIFKSTNSSVIIDSSKSPNMIPILKRLGFNIIVIHLTRRFGDVLNSYKKSFKKDLEGGIEQDIKPQKTSYVLFSWMIKNFLTLLYSNNIKRIRIKYEDLVKDPSSSIAGLLGNNKIFLRKLEERGPFIPKHLVAGNRIRMNNQIFILKKKCKKIFLFFKFEIVSHNQHYRLKRFGARGNDRAKN